MMDWAYLDPVTKQVIPTDDMLAAHTCLSDPKLKIVAQDELPDGRRVSTVFLGLDHGFGGTHKWFETMVFKKDTFDDEFQRRYETWAEAHNSHIDIVHRLTNGASLADL